MERLLIRLRSAKRTLILPWKRLNVNSKGRQANYRQILLEAFPSLCPTCRELVVQIILRHPAPGGLEKLAEDVAKAGQPCENCRKG